MRVPMCDRQTTILIILWGCESWQLNLFQCGTAKRIELCYVSGPFTGPATLYGNYPGLLFSGIQCVQKSGLDVQFIISMCHRQKDRNSLLHLLSFWGLAQLMFKRLSFLAVEFYDCFAPLNLEQIPWPKIYDVIHPFPRGFVLGSD